LKRAVKAVLGLAFAGLVEHPLLPMENDIKTSKK